MPWRLPDVNAVLVVSYLSFLVRCLRSFLCVLPITIRYAFNIKGLPRFQREEKSSWQPTIAPRLREITSALID